ncbi:hypothetical protein EJ913_06480 [Azospirillum doebereinerae]|uniref:Uncharacterized protein n=1 Tax=Azospirillum doebereinerae TaxID=92933 RepID=A0A433JBU6_9PROT|nr:hypothetical protein EJ913_06480 [Azospirillum doebereinerae]
MPRRPQGQHFLLTAAARTVSLATVMRMSPSEAEKLFAAIRWSATGGQPCVTVRRCFQLSTSWGAISAPKVMSIRRAMPRHMTVFPGGGSQPRAR